VYLSQSDEGVINIEVYTTPFLLLSYILTVKRKIYLIGRKLAANQCRREYIVFITHNFTSSSNIISNCKTSNLDRWISTSVAFKSLLGSTRQNQWSTCQQLRHNWWRKLGFRHRLRVSTTRCILFLFKTNFRFKFSMISYFYLKGWRDDKWKNDE